MKTVRLERDFDYWPTKHVVRAYKGGKTYKRVPEAAATAIVDAGAGRIVGTEAEDAPRRSRKRDRSE